MTTLLLVGSIYYPIFKIHEIAYKDYDETKTKIEQVSFIDLHRDSLDSFYQHAPEPKNIIAWRESLNEYSMDFNNQVDSLLNLDLEYVSNLCSVRDHSLLSELVLKSLLYSISNKLKDSTVRAPNLYESYGQESFYDHLKQFIEEKIDKPPIKMYNPFLELNT